MFNWRMGAKSKVTHKDVAEKFDGGNSNNTSAKQAGNIEARTSPDAIQDVGTVVNNIFADVIVESSDLNICIH